MTLLLRRKKFISNLFPRLILGFGFIYIYCEYLIYYVTQIQCGWPMLTKVSSDGEPVYVMVIADTHLLGARNGHWLDKWRREWQMQRAFQTAMTLHHPEVVFVLGDLFDEGKWCPEEEFNDYVERFHKIFRVPHGTVMYSVAGNHDIGFHYSKKLEREVRIAGPIKSDVFRRITPHLAKRFESRLNSPPVSLVTVKGNHFVLINSMAMEGDGCTLCSRAVAEIDKIAKQFSIQYTPQGHWREDIMYVCYDFTMKSNKTILNYVVRIVYFNLDFYLHYTSIPPYESDSVCTEPDAAPLPERNSLFEERWDCLSKESTEYLVESLRPRAALGAHTHHCCVVRHSFVPTADHKIEFVEYTVPSFSWRNRLDPKYYLLTITPEEVKVSKCGMPREWTMQVTAILMTLALLVYLRYSSSKLDLFGYKYLSGKIV